MVPGKRLLQLAQKHGAVAEAGERVQQPVFAIGLGAQELGLNARVHHRQVDGLDDVIVGALIERVDDGFAIVERAHHDDRQLAGRICRAQQAQEVEPAHAGHHLIEQDQIVVRVVDLFERLRAVFGDFDLIAAASQAAKKQIAILRVVVDDQQFAGIRCHSPSLQRARLCAARGILFGQIRRILRTLAAAESAAAEFR